MDCTSVGNFIAELRKEKGLTQAELAERVGVTGGAVSKWERGLCYPDIETVVRLAEVLDLSVGEILAGQRIQVYTPETVDTLAKESIAAYSGSERRRMLRRMGAVLAALALLAAILIPVLVRQMTPQPVSGFERTYWDYQALYHFDDTDIGQLVAQYQLNGEPLNVFASYLVRWGGGRKDPLREPDPLRGAGKITLGQPLLRGPFHPLRGGGQLPGRPPDLRQGGGQGAQHRPERVLHHTLRQRPRHCGI